MRSVLAAEVFRQGAETRDSRFRYELQCNSLLNAVVELVRDRGSWNGTATELLSRLNGSVDGIPGDATRLSKALAKLASSLSDAGITVARTRTKHARRISITRR